MPRTTSWPCRIASGTARLLTFGAIATAAATTFGLFNARRFGIRYETLRLLPAGSAPFRILHIGDMHLVRGDHSKINFVRSLANLAPDFVINTGDNPGGLDAVDDVIEAVEPLLDIPGVFVAGSNDFYGPRPANPLRYLRAPSDINSVEELRQTIDAKTMFETFSENGQWHRVGNRSLILPAREDLTLHLAGTHDAHMQADAWPGFHEPAAETHLRIAVTHAPYRRVLDAAIIDGADLVFAGHTHGGQVALPHYGAIVTNCDLPTGIAAALFDWRAGGNTGTVNVTAGIGSSPTMPVRAFCPPEAVVIDLVAA